MAQRLRHALAEQGMSARGLSKRFAVRFGGKPESHRRKISKWLADTDHPDDAAAMFLAETFGKPDGYFTTSQPRHLRLADLAAEQAEMRVRLEELATRVGDLGETQTQFARELAEVRRIRRRAEPTDR